MKTPLAVRIGLTVTIAFLAIWVIATAYVLRRSDVNAQAAIPTPAKVAAIARVLDTVPPNERETTLPALSSPLLEVSVEPASAVSVTSQGEEGQADAKKLLNAYRAALPGRETWLNFRQLEQEQPRRGVPRLLRSRDTSLALYTTLKNGDVLVLRSLELFPMTAFGLPLGFGAGLLGTLLALLMLVFLLRQIRPLKELAHAVDKIDLRDDPKPIRDVRSSVPEIRALVAAFNRQQERLSDLLKSRLALVGGLQHDVRTFATKARLRLENEAASPGLDRAISDLDDMVRLLDDALLATQGTEMSSDTVLELVDVRELLVLEKDARPDQKLSLEEDAANTSQPLYVLGNRLALRRVYSNLIDNAVAYGQHARVSIASSVDRIIVTVDDRGPGIPLSMRDMVREPFVRLEQSRARATGGSGLGLAIVSNIVTRHEGRFEIHDAPGGGARIVVDLPRFRTETTDPMQP